MNALREDIQLLIRFWHTLRNDHKYLNRDMFDSLGNLGHAQTIECRLWLGLL
jgi:hypothetical protein